VGEAEFDQCYEEYKSGRFKFEVEETTFDPVAYAAFLESIAIETEAFVKRRDAAGQAAVEEERGLLETWRSKQSADEAIKGVVEDASGVNVAAPMSSSVWKLLVAVGDVVEDGQVLAILEAMKMEIRTCARVPSPLTISYTSRWSHVRAEGEASCRWTGDCLGARSNDHGPGCVRTIAGALRMGRVTPLRAGRKACYKSKIISFTCNRMLHSLQQHNLLKGRFITDQAVDNGTNG
jgi:biotin carboxyl carrier protein